MPKNRVIGLLAAYFNQPYPEYREIVLEIRDSGGLNAEELRLIRSQVLSVDANAIIRQSGTTETTATPARASRRNIIER